MATARSRSAAWLALVLLLPAAPVGGQVFLMGERVLIEAPGALTLPARGRVARRDSVELRLQVQRGVDIVIPVHAIEAVQISYGRPYASHIVGGAAIGVLAGAVAGGVIGASLDDSGYGYGALFGTIIGAGLGVPLGGGIGAALAREEWREAGVPTRTSPAPDTTSARVLVEPGTRLRVSPLAGRRMNGKSMFATTGIRLDHDDRPVEIAWSEIGALQARGGRDRQKGAIIGASIVGGVALVAGGYDVASDELSTGEWGVTIVTNAIVGAGIGYLLAPRGWVDVPLPRRR